MVKLILFLSKKSPRGRRLDNRSSRNLLMNEKRASLAILEAAAPRVCAVSLDKSGVDIFLWTKLRKWCKGEKELPVQRNEQK